MLYQTPRLQPVDRRVLEQIDSPSRPAAARRAAGPMKRTLDLRKALTASAIAASNTIEGYRVDARDVADLMDGEREVDASDEDRAETLAYQQAMTCIQSLHDAADFRYCAMSATCGPSAQASKDSDPYCRGGGPAGHYWGLRARRFSAARRAWARACW
ncbi:hypothetical protein [Kitasatospora sp. NPDC056184]|uniref:hypothetical protein n=1 Tax=Kitasatospora sp. NPDC056184 TaxID=3345738 RepID=UPI0035E1DA6B